MGRAKRLLLTTVVAVVGLFCAYSLLPLTGRNRWVGIVLGAAIFLSVIPLLVLRVRTVLHAERPVAEAASAVVLLTALVIVGPSAAYFTMAGGGDQFDGLETKLDAVYFAVTVMSTVGFGDITPTGQAARLVTTIHILFAVAFFGAAIRLVTWATRTRLDEQGGPRRDGRLGRGAGR
jgi:voltage-gated potassium channel